MYKLPGTSMFQVFLNLQQLHADIVALFQHVSQHVHTHITTTRCRCCLWCLTCLLIVCLLRNTPVHHRTIHTPTSPALYHLLLTCESGLLWSSLSSSFIFILAIICSLSYRRSSNICLSAANCSLYLCDVLVFLR